jgi:hypothetical protein
VASKTTVSLVDDITGEPAQLTVRFGYEGKNYEIDLTETNAKALEESLQEFIPHARTVTAKRLPAQQTDRATNDAIRAWATAKGHELAQRGRIPKNIIDAYHTAQGA